MRVIRGKTKGYTTVTGKAMCRRCAWTKKHDFFHPEHTISEDFIVTENGVELFPDDKMVCYICKKRL